MYDLSVTLLLASLMHQLTLIDRIAIRVRSLLMLLPNDPDVVQAYEQILDSSQVDSWCHILQCRWK